MAMTLAGQTLKMHIENGDVPAVVSLLKAGNINLDERDADGQTFLMSACQIGEQTMIEEILKQGEESFGVKADINAVDNDNWTALLNASKEGHHRGVEALLRHGADIEHRDIGGWTGLMWACYKGRVEVARVLLENGANCNVKGEHHMSCLTWAAGRGHTVIVRMLLDHGAKVNTADKYGTTPLVWACRKGHRDIVEMLLNEHATVDNAGMNSQTALIMAAKGGYSDVVHLLLDCSPNVNATDKDGYTALTWAAKEGFPDIAYSIIQKEAYVNLPDRYGDTILIHAVKGGHVEVVQALLKKAADVDIGGIDNKTALYWAVEKGHLAILKLLLDYNASKEIPNKDGDTPLMKAVRGRNTEIVERLVLHGAKVSAVDKKGDTPLHIAVRGRSKRITEILLRNPKDSRLLYKPNKAGETPYHMDASHHKSILSQIFGARHLNAEDSIQGYDIYSSTIADVLSDPALRTPICVGLYAKWGSGKSFLIDKLQKEMKSFTQHNADPYLRFTAVQFVLCFVASLLIGIALSLALNWKWGLGGGLGLFTVLYILLGIVWFGSTRREWRWADSIGTYIARKLQFLQLLLQVLFCNQPQRGDRDSIAVRFLFTNNARLASVVGEKSIMEMISTLSDALEQEYGVLVTRLYRVFKPAKASTNGRFKTICCIPIFLIAIFIFCCFITGVTLLCVRGVHDFSRPTYTIENSVLIGIAIIIGITIIGNCYTWGRIIVNIIISPRRRIQKIANKINSLSGMEPVMQNLKHEVEWMGSMAHCMDAFLTTHTRLVVIVDGLDSCEQEKLLQVLDSVHMLFGDSGSPFITILAIDPHVIIKGIEHNLHGLFRESSINGHDYLRNIVHLPFFLQPTYGAGGRTRKDSVGSDSAPNHPPGSKFSRDPSISGSVGSLPESGGGGKSFKRNRSRTSHGSGYGSGVLTRHPSTFDLTKSLVKDTYFSDINPRNMRRLMNIIAVTGRLLRAFNVDFSWFRLAAWINVTEQWPYRLSWIILEIEDDDEIDNGNTLRVIYNKVQAKMPVSKDVDPLLEIDRNPRKLELFLSNYSPSLTVGDLRKFLQCTINVDPYLRKLIREMQQNVDNAAQELAPPGMAAGLPLLPPTPLPEQPAAAAPGPPQLPSGWSLRRGSASANDPSQFSGLRNMTPARGTPLRQMGGGPTPALHPGQMIMHPAYHVMSPAQQLMQLQQQQYPTPRSRHKVHVKGGLSDIALETLAVEDVCSLLTRLEGLNEAQIPEYQERLHRNNVNGMVLYNCEVSELKGVMSMTFGDWELFRAMVETLREEPAAGGANLSPSDPVPVDPPSPLLKDFTQDALSSVRLEQPKATRKARPKREKSLSPEPGTSKVGRFIVRPVAQTRRMKDGSEEPGLKLDPSVARKDTVVGEILYETRAIQDAMEGFGMSDYDDEDEDEEEVRMKLLDMNQLSVISEESVTAVEQYFHKLLTVEEEEKSQRSRSAETRDTSPRTTPRSSPTHSQPQSNMGTSAPGSVCSEAPDQCVVRMDPHESAASAGSAVTAPPSLASSDVYLTASDDAAHTDGKHAEHVKTTNIEKIGSSIKSKLQKFDFGDMSKKKKKKKEKEKVGEKNSPEEALLCPTNDKTPLLTPATSKEHLSVRQANQVADRGGPSAFHVVTPATRSRASSLPGYDHSSPDNMKADCSAATTPGAPSTECSAFLGATERTHAAQTISLHTLPHNNGGESTDGLLDTPNAVKAVSEGNLLVDAEGKMFRQDGLTKDESFV